MLFPTKVLICLFSYSTLVSLSKAQEPCQTPSAEDGYCVHYRDCPFVNELNRRFGTQLPQYFKDYIFRSKCSKDNEPIRLCCKLPTAPTPDISTETEPKENRFTMDLDTNKDIVSQLNPEGYNILNALICGKSDGKRIAGGNKTDLAEFPWMALLRYDVPGEQYLCGGSLITNRFVLTATHCVNRPLVPLVGVRLGEYDLATDEDCKKKGPLTICNPPVEDFGIENIIQHPEYSERKRINDIALIKLDRNVEFKKHIKPICLPITPDSQRMSTEDGFLIAGWGSTEQGTKSTDLLKAKVDYQIHSICENAYRISINHKHLCAGDLESGRDTCRGDSGGPLMTLSKYKQFKTYVQYGVVASGGLACNLKQALPGIYTNVLNFLPWITNNIVV